jgi:hypothetical protein
MDKIPSFPFLDIEGEPQKFSPARFIYGAFVPINLQLEHFFYVMSNAFHHSLSGFPTPHVDITVIGIPAEFMPTLFQFFVQFIQYDITQ